MPIIQELVNLEDIFRGLQEPPVFINDLASYTEEDRERVKSLVMTQYSSDMVSMLPRCRCGELKGEFSVAVVCNICGEVVKSNIESDIEPIVWFRQPHDVEKLISPIIWIMLKNRFKRSGFNVIQWLVDTDYRAKVKQPPVINKIVSAGIQRGYNNFVQNFDSIMGFLFSLKDFKVKNGQVDHLKNLIDLNRGMIFSSWIPLPNKVLLITEQTHVGLYVDSTVIDALNPIKMLVGIDKQHFGKSTRSRENRTVKALSALAAYYERFYRVNLSPKTAQFRRHVYGTRMNFCFRAVISSLTGDHRYDSIIIPWGIAVTVFRPHLMNKLINHYGFDQNSALGLLLGHVGIYSEFLDKLLTEIIRGAPGGRYPCLMERNPSLLQGSIQRLGIDGFTKDPTDYTIKMSILIVRSYNADFDGDALAVTIALDNKIADSWYPLSPHFNIFQLSRPHVVSGNVAIPKPNIATMARWIKARKNGNKLTA